MQELLSFSHSLADTAGEVIRRHFRTPFEIIAKADETPVTVADRAVEAALREMIEKTYPDDGILGEEYGVKSSQNGRTWVLDPIDGTKSFIIGRPTFGTLIALCEDDVPVLGVIDQPILNERWIGAKGIPTTFNGAPAKTRPCASLKNAIIGCTSPRQVPDLWPHFYSECKAVVWGGDCYAFGAIATGWIDVIVETHLQPYDFAALIPVIENAGGMVCDWEGNPITLQSKGDVIALGDPSLLDAALNLVSQ